MKFNTDSAELDRIWALGSKIGPDVRAERLRRGFKNQTSLARELGVSVFVISMIESGQIVFVAEETINRVLRFLSLPRE